MKTRSLVCFFLPLGLACASKTETQAPVAASSAAEQSPAGPKPEYGSFGFDTPGMKPAVAPGENFYTHANGNWEENTPIPSDRSNYGMFTKLDDLSNERTREVIETASKEKGAEGSEAQKVGDFYASFMDEAAIEQAGLKPIAKELTGIDQIKTKKDLARVLGEGARTGTGGPFGFYIGVDDKQPDRYLATFGQSGIGLPDRDYFLKKSEPRYAEILVKYQKHIENMLTLAGVKDAAKKAKTIIELEEKLAKAHWSRVDSRDADKTYNKWMKADFAKKAKGFDWDTYFGITGLAGQKEFVVLQPSAIEGAAKLLDKEPLQAWKDYLTYWTVKGAAPLLGKALVEENFDFNGRVLGGTPELKARWKRGVELVNESMGEAVGKLYVEKYFPPEAKAKADALVKNIIVAMDHRLENLTWMSPETKAKAKAKLAAFTPKIGYPDKWRDYASLKIVAGEAYGNAERAAAFEYDRNLKKLGQSVDRGEWFMTPMTVNAYANPPMNEIVFPAAILQPPFFDPKADPAVNYGGIGAVIGHEISHHFDDQGRKYDATGKLNEWWNKEDIARFDALTKQLVAQYAKYEVFPGAFINGELTLGENIADLAGLTVAYDAYQRSLAGQPAPTIEGTTGEQRFFLGWAQVWRRKYREQELRKRLVTDPHSPSEQRASVVRNLDPWYEAYKPQSGQALFLTPETRVRIW